MNGAALSSVEKPSGFSASLLQIFSSICHSKAWFPYDRYDRCDRRRKKKKTSPAIAATAIAGVELFLSQRSLSLRSVLQSLDLFFFFFFHSDRGDHSDRRDHMETRLKRQIPTLVVI